MARDYTRKEVLDIIEREARERNIPRDDFMRFAYIETGGTFDESASRGPKGAKGLFQFVPSTAQQYGISGRELDPVANADSAARLYLDNQRVLVRRHDADHRPYLSGKPQPDGLDMYLAHQQGAGGYRSLQAAIATGQFSRDDTRRNILNNVSARDLRAVAGVSMDDFRAMSDKDMAQTFVRYWDTKFDRVRIPEKGIEPVSSDRTRRQDTPQQSDGAQHSQARPGIQLAAAHAIALKYDDVGYKMGGKNVESGAIDCSGWVVALQNATMREINTKAGVSPRVFGTNDFFRPAYDGSGTIVQKAAARSGVLLEGKQVNASTLKEGMVVGLDTGPAKHDKWKGIDHVAMVVRDPKSGELMVTESKGGRSDRGVRMIPMDDFLTQYRNAKLYAADPLAKAHDLLQGRQQAVGARTASDGIPAYGEHGADVKALQQNLKALGIKANDGTSLTGTGYYGDKTREVVANFQRQNGMEPTGVADKATLEVIGRKLPDGKVSVEVTRLDPQQPARGLLLSDSRHPNNDLYEAFRNRPELAGAKPETIANIAMVALENGIRSADRIGSVNVSGTNVLVRGNNVNDPGDRFRVDTSAPTATMQQMSDHMAQQTLERQDQERQRQQVQPSPAL